MTQKIKKQANRTNGIAIQFRCDKALEKKINRDAKACKLSKSEYIRKLCKQEHPKALPPEDFYQIKELMESVIEHCKNKSKFLLLRGDLLKIDDALQEFNEKVDRFYEDSDDGDNEDMAD